MADTRKYLQVQKTTLAGSGISSTATTIILSSLTHIAAVGGGTVAMTDLGTLAWGTLEPGTSREEIISFTGITQNGDGTATLTGVTRNLKSYAPYDQYSSTGFAHAGGAIFVVTNNPQLYDNFANKANDETVTGLWDFSTSIPTLPASNPTTTNQATRKAYVDGLDALAVHLAGTETITGVKTFTSTAKAKYDTHPTFSADEEIIDKKYADDLAIAGAPDASETVKGIVEEATQAEVTAGTATGGTGARLYVNPAKLSAAAINASTGAGDAGKIIKTSASGLLDATFTTTPVVRTYLNSGSPHTWTKPSGLKYVIVKVQGAGGSAENGGGGGGAYGEKLIAAASLGATETVTVGAAATGSGNTSFGTHVTAGNGGNASGNTAGTGGTASGGDVNISGTDGQTGLTGLGADNLTQGGDGGNSILGNGGSGAPINGSASSAIDGKNASGYGGGGGGRSPATDGNPTGSAGSSTQGIVIVTEYYN